MNLENKLLHERLAHEVASARVLLEGHGPFISIFGGARVQHASRHYLAARDTARLVSAAGLSVLTGGGPGIMQAANEGARMGGNGKSAGLLITLPFEEGPNPYLDIAFLFQHFASRKVTFCRHSSAFVFFPGGHGTLDELGEVLALLATEKMQNVPVILYDSVFWAGFLDWMRHSVLREGLVSQESLDRLIVVDHPQDVLAALTAANVVGAT